MAIKGLKFSINALQAGQKSSILNATPQLIAKSTAGQFTITSPVSKALNIAAGENVMFFNNLSGIEAMIQAAPQELLDYCAENGWDINTAEGKDALIKEQLQYYIAKGVLLYKRNGEQVLGTVRVTKEEKAAYLAEHAEELIAGLTDEEKANLAEAKGLAEYDDVALASALTPDDVPSPTFHAASGSKTAATANATGIGLQLNFTDTAIWDALKADLGEDKTNKNRYFDVKLTEPEEVEFNNGKETVKVLAYPIEFVEDKEPMARGKKVED